MSGTDIEQLIDATFLFRFASPCLQHTPLWNESKGIQLPESHRLPSFRELDGKSVFADVRAAWAETGLAFTVRVRGKKQLPWCRYSRAEDSDGFQFWIDTRDTKTIHRAGRFCHRFVALPAGQGRAMDEPSIQLMPINRAREYPKPIAASQLRVRSEKRIDGYVLEMFLPASALTGFDPSDHPRLGFSYAVVDRELGWQTYSVGPELPFTDDPSLWGTLELTAG